ANRGIGYECSRANVFRDENLRCNAELWTHWHRNSTNAANRQQCLDCLYAICGDDQYAVSSAYSGTQELSTEVVNPAPHLVYRSAASHSIWLHQEKGGFIRVLAQNQGSDIHMLPVDAGSLIQDAARRSLV